MNNFRKQHGSGGFDRDSRRSFGGNRGGRDSERREMYPATCSKCGKSCEVPFRPTGERPVFCNDCFHKRNGAPGGQIDRSSFRPVPPPAPARSFSPQPQTGGKSIADLERQIGAMNTKIDSMLRILESMPRAASPVSVRQVPSKPEPPAVGKPETPENAKKDSSKKKPVKKGKAVKK